MKRRIRIVICEDRIVRRETGTEILHALALVIVFLTAELQFELFWLSRPANCNTAVFTQPSAFWFTYKKAPSMLP